MDTATTIATMFDQFHTANLRCKRLTEENPDVLPVKIQEWRESDKIRAISAEWLIVVLSAFTNK